MLLLRVCRGTLVPQAKTLFKVPSSTPQLTKLQAVRLLSNDGRTSFARSARKRTTITEQVMAPAGETCNKLFSLS